MSSSRKSKAEREREKVIQDRLQVLLFRMLQDEDNKYCVDCDSKGPRWASWNLGIFVCIRCAGIHRNLGVHISRVKSVNLDSWTPQQVASMQIMGNSRARAVYEAQVPENFRRPTGDAPLETFIRAKYEKKKYIAREWVPTSPPELPEGWTALIEAEKQKKDIRSIVLPSHTSDEDLKNSANNAKRERQSPANKEKPKKEPVNPPPPSANDASKNNNNKKSNSVEASFDLLSLGSPPSQQQQQPQKQAVPAPAKPTPGLANDLLCLGASTESGGSATEFDDFVGVTTAASKSSSAANTPKSAGNNVNKPASNADVLSEFTFNTASTEGQNAGGGGGGMSKDSIMALFNKAPPTGMPPAAAPAGPPNPLQGLVFPSQPQQPQQQQQQQPPFMNTGNFGGFGMPAQAPQAGNSGIPGNSFNNPFLGMTGMTQNVPPMTTSTNDPNNLFAGINIHSGTTGHNFLQ